MGSRGGCAEQARQPGTHQRTTGQTHRRRQAGSQAQKGSPREGLDVQIQVGREIRHGPAGAYLPCAASPYLQCDARLQPVENDFSRGDIAFARDGFAERAQNGQRVRVRSPIGTPHDHGVGDVLTEEGSQVGAVVFQLGLHPSQCQPPERAESRWTRRALCRRLPRAEVRTSAGLKSVPGMRLGTSISEVWSHCCAAAWMREETAL